VKFFLSAVDRARIAAAARAAFPRECCGLIEGIWEADSASALRLHPAANLAEAADRFEIAPEDHFAALKAVDAIGMEYRVRELLEQPDRLARMRERARALARPHAAREVLRVVLARA